jgi:hypothetical protein
MKKSVWSTSDRPAMVVCWWVQVHSGSLNQCFLHRQFVGSFTIKMENFGFFFWGRPNVNSASFCIFLENVIIILKSETKS